MSGRVSKAHVLKLREFTTQAGEVRFEYSCPSGCMTGYVWGKNERSVRHAAAALVESHRQLHIPVPPPEIT